jgi:hypothetical protein
MKLFAVILAFLMVGSAVAQVMPVVPLPIQRMVSGNTVSFTNMISGVQIKPVIDQTQEPFKTLNDVLNAACGVGTIASSVLAELKMLCTVRDIYGTGVNIVNSVQGDALGILASLGDQGLQLLGGAVRDASCAPGSPVCLTTLDAQLKEFNKMLLTQYSKAKQLVHKALSAELNQLFKPPQINYDASGNFASDADYTLYRNQRVREIYPALRRYDALNKAIITDIKQSESDSSLEYARKSAIRGDTIAKAVTSVTELANQSNASNPLTTAGQLASRADNATSTQAATKVLTDAVIQGITAQAGSALAITQAITTSTNEQVQTNQHLDELVRIEHNKALETINETESKLNETIENIDTEGNSAYNAFATSVAAASSLRDDVYGETGGTYNPETSSLVEW